MENGIRDLANHADAKRQSLGQTNKLNSTSTYKRRALPSLDAPPESLADKVSSTVANANIGANTVAAASTASEQAAAAASAAAGAARGVAAAVAGVFGGSPPESKKAT